MQGQKSEYEIETDKKLGIADDFSPRFRACLVFGALTDTVQFFTLSKNMLLTGGKRSRLSNFNFKNQIILRSLQWPWNAKFPSMVR